jgi:hypothetical protein
MVDTEMVDSQIVIPGMVLIGKPMILHLQLMQLAGSTLNTVVNK